MKLLFQTVARILVLAFVVALAAGGYACAAAACKGATPEPSYVETFTDGGPDDSPDPTTVAYPDCARACKALHRLACPEAQKPDGGMSCYDVCAKAEMSGRFSLNPACVAGAGSREELRANCKTVRCGVP